MTYDKYMVVMVKSKEQWVTNAIKREENNGKVFRIREKTETVCQIGSILKRHIFNLKKDIFEDSSLQAR